jgi:hypothetical protein
MEDAAINNHEQSHEPRGARASASHELDEPHLTLDRNEHRKKRKSLDACAALLDCPETSTLVERSDAKPSAADYVDKRTTPTETVDHEESNGNPSDSNEPTWELVNSSDGSMCPDMSEPVIAQLQGDNPTPCLLELARFFRAKAVLLRQQAKFLDELAITDDIEGPDVDMQEKLYLNHVTYYAKKAHPLMDDALNRMDAIEDSLFPWVEARYVSK